MEKNKGQKIYKIIMLVIITVILTSLITAFVTYNYVTNKDESIGKTTNNYKGIEYTLSRFRSMLEKKYYGQINDEAMVESAIKGYIEGLDDPYTVYYTKEEMDDIMQETNGNYVGIGVYMLLNKEDNTIVLVPMEESPAVKVGIQAGDILTKIDGQTYTGEQMQEASNKIKGESGTKLKIEILRNNETKEFEIERAKILISHISKKMLDNNIGYLSISDFEGGCADEFEKKYKELEKQGIKKLIIDIRNNGGGIVDEALNIADLITEKGSTLLITTDKNKKEEITKASKEPIIKVPVVVLTNGYSASASEILAGALKDNQKATIVGTKTYGKGVIQELHRLTDGSGIKITTNEYFTPKHTAINKVGISPDVEVELPDDLKGKTNIPEEKDTQLQKAIEVLKEK